MRWAGRKLRVCLVSCPLPTPSQRDPIYRLHQTGCSPCYGGTSVPYAIKHCIVVYAFHALFFWRSVRYRCIVDGGEFEGHVNVHVSSLMMNRNVSWARATCGATVRRGERWLVEGYLVRSLRLRQCSQSA